MNCLECKSDIELPYVLWCPDCDKEALIKEINKEISSEIKIHKEFSLNDAESAETRDRIAIFESLLERIKDDF
jgi:hypothetical protein